MTPTPIDRLSKNPLFQSLTDAQRSQISAMLVYEHFDLGTLIFQEGEPGDSVYFIETGKVTFYTKDAVGDQKVFRTLSAGEFFGEISTLTDKTRSAYAHADTEVFAWRLSGDKFDNFLVACPILAVIMLREMALRLRTSGAMLHHTVMPGVSPYIEADRTPVEKKVQSAVRSLGTVGFVSVNLIIFSLWIFGNAIFRPAFDAPPFGYLGLFVTTEALIVALLILAKQNRDERDSDIRANLILANTSATEDEIRELRRAVHDLAAIVLRSVDTP